MSEQSEPEPGTWWRVPLPPWWIWVLAAVTDIGTGFWRVLTTSSAGTGLFFRGLIWPGLGIAGAVLVVAWLGWSLDLE